MPAARLKLYLASSSPRRRALLRAMGLRYALARPDYREGPLPGGPARLVRAHALGKALSAVSRVREGVVLGADTVVWHRGRVLGKPRDLAHAERMLASLAGRRHTVYTGVALVTVRAGRVVAREAWVERTHVRLRALGTDARRRYLRRIGPLDKAGAYAIQSRRADIVEAVEGSCSNAAGLPVLSLARRLGVPRGRALNAEARR